MLKRLEWNVLDMGMSAVCAFKLHCFNLYERVPCTYRNVPQEHGFPRLHMHHRAAVRTDSVRAPAVEMASKDVAQIAVVAGIVHPRIVGVEAGKVGRKAQHAEIAGFCQRWNALGRGFGSLRKGADWSNAHGREPRLGFVVCVLPTLSKGSFFFA